MPEVGAPAMPEVGAPLVPPVTPLPEPPVQPTPRPVGGAEDEELVPFPRTASAPIGIGPPDDEEAAPAGLGPLPAPPFPDGGEPATLGDVTAAAAGRGTQKRGMLALLLVGIATVIAVIAAVVIWQKMRGRSPAEEEIARAQEGAVAAAEEPAEGAVAPKEGEAAKPAEGAEAPAPAEEAEKAFVLPEGEGLAKTEEEGLAVRVTAEAIQAGEMDDIDVEDGVVKDAEGDPPTLAALREETSGKAAHVLADARLPYKLVASALFSVGALGDTVQIAGRPQGAAADDEGHGLVPVQLALAKGFAAAPPPLKIKMKVKAKAGGGLKKSKKAIKAALGEAQPAIEECVANHVEGKAKAKYKFVLKFDETGKSTGAKLAKDPLDGEEPSPCIQEVVKGLAFGEPAKAKPSKVKLTVAFSAKPAKKKGKKKKPPPELRVEVGAEGYKVTPPEGEAFDVAKKEDAWDAVALAEKLAEAAKACPEGTVVRVLPGGDVPHGAVVDVLAVLGKEVEGQPLFPVPFLAPAQ